MREGKVAWKGEAIQGIGSMQDHEFFARVLGLVDPWVVKSVKLDLPSRVEVTLECKDNHA